MLRPLRASASGIRVCTPSPQPARTHEVAPCPDRPTRWLFAPPSNCTRKGRHSASVPWLSTRAMVRCNLSLARSSPGRPPRPAPGLATLCVMIRLRPNTRVGQQKNDGRMKFLGDNLLELHGDFLWKNRNSHVFRQGCRKRSRPRQFKAPNASEKTRSRRSCRQESPSGAFTY